MAFFQLMLKANKLEKARLTYQDEKLRSIEISRGAKVHYTLSQKIRHKKIILKRKFRNCLKKCTTCPEDSWFHQKSVLLRTEGTFENFILKSVMGFLGGIFLTYMFFMFFVFQLNFTLSSATMLCSIFGIILTIGLAFSYRVRCVVFLLLPQFFSKRGRQALMAYAFILALTGPAKNTLHNTGVLSESLACGQEQLKEAVKSIVDLVKQPFYALRDAISKVIKTVKVVVKRIKQALLAIKRMVLSMLRVIKAVFQWLGSVINICNKKLGTPFERCQRAFDGAVADCYAKLGPIFGTVCNLAYVAETLCYIVKPLDFICILVSYVADTIIGEARKKIKKFAKHMKAMFYVKIKFSHSFHFETNKSRNLDEISTGIVTEIRSRTDRFLTVFDWMSFATSFFVLFMLLRVIHYRQKWLTNERFDNRYLTEDLRHIDLIRAKKDKETVLPLNPRERNKYIPLGSIALIRIEKIYLAKSAVFLGLTTCKLCIHMMADYSLYWVLSTIRYHGRFETKVQRTNAVGVYVSGNGYLAELYRSIVRAFSPLGAEMEMDTVPCLPDPVPPDLDRYTQIISLIVFSWIMAIFEPYGLRLRHVVMSYYHPQRAQQRAVWLYNHIIRSRGSFLKYARRQLRRKFGMNDGKPREHVTLKERILAICPFINYVVKHNERACLLCGTVERENQVPHAKCPTPGCIGLFCTQCFSDLQNICTICLAPMEYGDLSDMSEEKDSSDDQRPATHKKPKKIVPKTKKIVEHVKDKKKVIPKVVPKTKKIAEDAKDKKKLITKDLDERKDESAVTRTTTDTETTADVEATADTEATADPEATADAEATDDAAEATDDTGDISESTDYSQSYQDEEPAEMDLSKDHRIHHKDVEAQKLHDDVTIQIFNEPLRGDATSGTESPTSCFVVRARRRMRSRLKDKRRSCLSRDYSSSSSSSSIADTESLSTEEIEEDEVIHIEIEDDSEKGALGAGGSKILHKKGGRVDKIVDALCRVSWLNRKTEKKNDREKLCREIETKRASLMNKVIDLVQSAEPPKSVKYGRRSKNDRDKLDECHCSSSSSESSLYDEDEKHALINSRMRNSRDESRRKCDDRSQEKSRRYRDYCDDYIYETSWESHRQRGGGDTPRFMPGFIKDQSARRINSMSKSTKYSEINEKNLNKMPDGISSSESGKREKAWNIRKTKDKQDTTSSYSQSSQANTNSLGMSTIEEDSKELSTTENENVKSQNETENYVDVTGLSSPTTDTSPAKTIRKRRVSKYVTNDELQALEDRKRRKKMIKRRLVELPEAPDLYDPLAGLEIYGVHGKTRKKQRKFWMQEETTEIDEDETEKSGEEEKLAETDTSAETQTELEKSDTTETSGKEMPTKKGKGDDEKKEGRKETEKEKPEGKERKEKKEEVKEPKEKKQEEKERKEKKQEVKERKETKEQVKERKEKKRKEKKPEGSKEQRKGQKERESDERDEIYRERRICVKRLNKDKCKKHEKRRKKRDKEKSKCEKTAVPEVLKTSSHQQTEIGRICGSQANKPQEWFYEEQRRIWEQMCAKMAEYSHSFGCPKRDCRPTPYFPHEGCTIPMYNPKLFRAPTQGHTCPRFPSGPQKYNRDQKPVPPVLKRFLPKYQRPDIVDELKSHDRRRLIRERDERRRKCDCGQMTTPEMDRDFYGRNILSRPCNIPERTDVLPYQETESFKNLVNEYRRITIPRKIKEASREDEDDIQDITDEQEPLIALSKKADNSKDLKRLYPPESKKRPSSIAQIGNRIASVFKTDTWRKRKKVVTNEKIADSESWSEMSNVVRCVKDSGRTTSAEETTDNNETTK